MEKSDKDNNEVKDVSRSGRQGERSRSEWDDFDYVQCSAPDIHGIPRGRVVPRKLVQKTVKDGYGLFQG